MSEQEMRREVAGEDGIRVETVVVTERNAAQQVTREVEVERIFEGREVRQTTTRAVGYDTLTSKAHERRPLPPMEASELIAEAVERGLLTEAIRGEKNWRNGYCTSGGENWPGSCCTPATHRMVLDDSQGRPYFTYACPRHLATGPYGSTARYRSNAAAAEALPAVIEHLRETTHENDFAAAKQRAEAGAVALRGGETIIERIAEELPGNRGQLRETIFDDGEQVSSTLIGSPAPIDTVREREETLTITAERVTRRKG